MEAPFLNYGQTAPKVASPAAQLSGQADVFPHANVSTSRIEGEAHGFQQQGTPGQGNLADRRLGRTGACRRGERRRRRDRGSSGHRPSFRRTCSISAGWLVGEARAVGFWTGAVGFSEARAIGLGTRAIRFGEACAGWLVAGACAAGFWACAVGFGKARAGWPVSEPCAVGFGEARAVRRVPD
jgi:hypothetical protein